jgi:hypothetical protein
LEDVASPKVAGAVDRAYSDVMRYMTLTALVASAVPVVCVWWVRDFRLSERHNLAEEVRRAKEEDERKTVGEGRWKRWWRTGKWW